MCVRVRVRAKNVIYLLESTPFTGSCYTFYNVPFCRTHKTNITFFTQLVLRKRNHLRIILYGRKISSNQIVFNVVTISSKQERTITTKKKE